MKIHFHFVRVQLEQSEALLEVSEGLTFRNTESTENAEKLAVFSFYAKTSNQ